MPFIKVGAVSALPPGSVTEAYVGDETYALCNLGGEIHALGGICPHAGGPIGQGALDGNLLVCPWHEWAYDCRTGENDGDPDVKVETFPVRIDGDDILIEVP